MGFLDSLKKKMAELQDSVKEKSSEFAESDLGKKVAEFNAAVMDGARVAEEEIGKKVSEFQNSVKDNMAARKAEAEAKARAEAEAKAVAQSSTDTNDFQPVVDGPETISFANANVNVNSLLLSATTQSEIAMAKAIKAVAQVIVENFNTANVVFMAPASLVDPKINDEEALPIHFLFLKYGQPVFAVVVVTRNGYLTPRVTATRMACLNKGIGYLRVFATGQYADWITGIRGDGLRTTPETVAECKERLVDTIRQGIS